MSGSGGILEMRQTAAKEQTGRKGKQMTPTEKRIKRLWRAGRTSQEIAAEIGMNERMVQGILNDLGL